MFYYFYIKYYYNDVKLLLLKYYKKSIRKRTRTKHAVFFVFELTDVPSIFNYNNVHQY